MDEQRQDDEIERATAGGGVVVAPTLEEILSSLRSEVCAACGGRKVWMQAFCNTDFLALTIWQRKSVTSVDATYTEREPDVDGVDHEVTKVALGFAEAYLAALRHLQLNPTRVKHVAVRAGEWRFRNDDDLAAAGFKFIRHDRCEVPGCGRRVEWYWTPKGARMPVNLENYQPHATSCVDPEYFTKVREARKERKRQQRLQASARKQKSRRRA